MMTEEQEGSFGGDVYYLDGGNGFRGVCMCPH